MEISDITLHLQDIVCEGRRLILHVNIHGHYCIALLENSTKGYPRLSHRGQTDDLKVMHIHGVIDVPERVTFVVTNGELAVSFGGHSPLSIQVTTGDKCIVRGPGATAREFNEGEQRYAMY